MGPGFGDAVGALMLGRLIKFVVLPVAAACIGVGLLIGWLF
jgi:hypothetical protein